MKSRLPQPFLDQPLDFRVAEGPEHLARKPATFTTVPLLFGRSSRRGDACCDGQLMVLVVLGCCFLRFFFRLGLNFSKLFRIVLVCSSVQCSEGLEEYFLHRGFLERKILLSIFPKCLNYHLGLGSQFFRLQQFDWSLSWKNTKQILIFILAWYYFMVMEALNRWACIAVMGALLDDALMPIAKQLHLIHHNVGVISIGSIIYVCKCICMYLYMFMYCICIRICICICICILDFLHLEPKWILVLKINPSKQGLL